MTELWFGISEKTQKEPYDPSVKETKTTNKYDNQRDIAREPSKEKFNGMYNYFKIDGQMYFSWFRLSKVKSYRLWPHHNLALIIIDSGDKDKGDYSAMVKNLNVERNKSVIPVNHPNSFLYPG